MNRIARLAAVLFLLFFLVACQLFETFSPGGLPGTAAPDTPAAPVLEVSPVPSIVPEDRAPTDEPAIVLVTRSFTEKSASPRYEIDVQWPELEWHGNPHVDAFNQAAADLAREEIDVFMQGIENTPDDPAFEEFGSSLTVRYTPTYLDNGLFSVHIPVSFYMAGAAHPAYYSHALSYDLRDGHTLALEELFQPGAPYLETISTLCLEDLEARGVLAWEDGALPDAENFQVWNITPGGLQITFDPYQVAPYAAGPQTVLISYDRLKEVINPQGPLAGFE